MRPIKVLLILFFPALLTLFCVRISFTEAFVDFLYPKVKLPPDPMPYELRLNIAKLGLRSVLSDKGMEEFKGSGLFNYREIKHMEDVKKLLGFLFAFLYVGLPAWLFLFLSLKNLREMGKVLFFGALLMELFALFVLFASFVDYEWLFVTFHNLFFDPYSWRFREEDMLLRVYPMDFWYKATIYTALMVFSINLLFQVIGLYFWRSKP
ncbi:MAG: TIGR01906 family membrane protein [Aquificaceae bacterium]